MAFDHGVLVVPVSGFDIFFNSLTVNLRSPKKGFERIYDTQLLVHRTTGGQLRTFRDPDWFMTLSQRVTFEALTETQINDLRNLYSQASGKTVGIRDCENRIWSAFLSEPKVTTFQSGKGCQYNVTFIFLAVFSQPPFSAGSGYTIGGGPGTPPNNTIPVLGLGDGDFVTPSSKRILSPTGAFLKGPTGNQLVHV